MAQSIVVNSQFTQKVFLDNFPIIAQSSKKEGDETCCMGLISKHLPEVLYPAINLKVFDKSKDFTQTIDQLLGHKIGKDTHILTSLNRYERKKNIPLALKAFAQFMEKDGNS